MDYEKKYKDALQAAKHALDCEKQGLVTTDKVLIERMFPELKESEDERINREITEFLVDFNNGEYERPNENTIDSWLSWLEKQGDKDKLIKELGEYKIKYTQKVLQNYLNNMTNKDDERLRKTTITFLKEFADKGYENAVECIDWLEKQGQKPQGKSALEAAKEEKVDNQNCVKSADEVGLKFKVGDWVVYKDDKTVYYITRIEESFILIADIDGDEYVSSPDLFKVYYRLWTIQDAKDGDILVDTYDNQPFLFSYIGKDGAKAHGGIDQYGRFILPYKYSKEDRWVLENAVPATKEQRDLLFAKMKEASFEWDEAKKELRKIEQNLANSEKAVKNDTLLDLLNKMPSCITVDGIDYHFVMKKTVIYMAYYEGEGEEGRDKTIFWIAGNPIDMLTEMLDKLKKEGLLE